MPDDQAGPDPLTGKTPSKIIAVHVSYRSRAMERGRLPRWPSYFLKPPNTLAADGDPVQRPPRCELLAFEGEVALIIGTRATRVSPADAWAHVGWVTAANDFGVYDLRYADNGSNMRSKRHRRIHAHRTRAAGRPLRRPRARPAADLGQR